MSIGCRQDRWQPLYHRNRGLIIDSRSGNPEGIQFLVQILHSEIISNELCFSSCGHDESKEEGLLGVSTKILAAGLSDPSARSNNGRISAASLSNYTTTK
jgi:hypothetical protein